MSPEQYVDSLVAQIQTTASIEGYSGLTTMGILEAVKQRLFFDSQYQVPTFDMDHET